MIANKKSLAFYVIAFLAIFQFACSQNIAEDKEKPKIKTNTLIIGINFTEGEGSLTEYGAKVERIPSLPKPTTPPWGAADEDMIAIPFDQQLVKVGCFIKNIAQTPASFKFDDVTLAGYYKFRAVRLQGDYVKVYEREKTKTINPNEYIMAEYMFVVPKNAALTLSYKGKQPIKD
jgi:hypothetical protein